MMLKTEIQILIQSPVTILSTKGDISRTRNCMISIGLKFIKMRYFKLLVKLIGCIAIGNVCAKFEIKTEKKNSAYLLEKMALKFQTIIVIFAKKSFFNEVWSSRCD